MENSEDKYKSPEVQRQPSNDIIQFQVDQVDQIDQIDNVQQIQGNNKVADIIINNQQNQVDSKVKFIQQSDDESKKDINLIQIIQKEDAIKPNNKQNVDQILIKKTQTQLIQPNDGKKKKKNKKLFESSLKTDAQTDDIPKQLYIPPSFSQDKFIDKLKTYTSLKSQYYLTEREFAVIDDYSSNTQITFLEKLQSLKWFQQLYKYVELFLSIKVLEPTNTLIYVWDVIHLLFILMCIFYIPLEFVSGLNFYDLYEGKWMTFLVITFLIFLFNVIFKFHIGYYEQGILELNKQTVAKNYLLNGLSLDLLAIIPLFIVQPNSQWWKILNILIYFKLFTVSEILNRYEELFQSQSLRTLPLILKMLKLLLTIMFFAHLFSCLFLGIAQLVINFSLAENNWMLKYKPDLLESGWFTQYIYSFYWSSTTMVTVGYGDITPANQYEVGIAIIAMYVACWTVSYSFSFIATLVQEMNKQEVEFNDEMKLVNKFLQFKEVEPDLKMEVRRSLRARFKQQINVNIFYIIRFDCVSTLTQQEEEQVYDKLPKSLKDKVISSSNYSYIKNIRFFYDNFSTEFLKKLALQLKSEIFLHNELIFKEGQHYENDQDNYLYIIQSGTINLFYYSKKRKEKTIIANLTKRQMFGEYTFITNQARTLGARSKGISQIFTVSRQDFLDLVKQFPKDQAKFCMIKDYTLCNENSKMLRIECFVCKKNHYSIQCPKVHFIPDQEKVLLKEMYYSQSENCVRKKYTRKKSIRNTYSAKNEEKIKLKEVQEQMILLWDVMNIEPEESDASDIDSDQEQESSLLSGKKDLNQKEIANQQINQINKTILNPLIEESPLESDRNEEQSNEEQKKKLDQFWNITQDDKTQNEQIKDIKDIKQSVYQRHSTKNATEQDVIQFESQFTPKNNTMTKSVFANHQPNRRSSRIIHLQQSQKQIPQNIQLASNKQGFSTFFKQRKQSIMKTQSQPPIRQSSINIKYNQIQDTSSPLSKLMSEAQYDDEQKKNLQSTGITPISIQDVQVDFPSQYVDQAWEYKSYFPQYNLSQVLTEQKINRTARNKRYHFFASYILPKEDEKKHQKAPEKSEKEKDKSIGKTIKNILHINK